MLYSTLLLHSVCINNIYFIFIILEKKLKKIIKLFEAWKSGEIPEDYQGVAGNHMNFRKKTVDKALELGLITDLFYRFLIDNEMILLSNGTIYKGLLVKPFRLTHPGEFVTILQQLNDINEKLALLGNYRLNYPKGREICRTIPSK
jgi:hypothetical protein